MENNNTLSLDMGKNNSLAKIALAISVILIILVVVLFVKMNSGGDQNSNMASSGLDSSNSDNLATSNGNQSNSNIVFFNMDSLNAKLLLFKEIVKEIQEDGKSAEKRMRSKEKEIDSWKKKWERKGKLLSSEEQQYYKEAEKMQAEAMQFEQNIQMKLGQEQEDLMRTYAIRISNYSSDFAKASGYSAVFSYQFGQSPWYYDVALDVTDKLAEIMNADFKNSNTDEGVDSTEEEN